MLKLSSSFSAPVFWWRSDSAARPMQAFDGLSAFAPLFGLAGLFSLAGDAAGLIGNNGLFYAAMCWLTALLCFICMMQPRKTAPLLGLAAVTLLLYLVRSPVASNNKTITIVMDLGILASAAMLYRHHRDLGTGFREELYEQIRIVARLLLAIMYFYGIFHKINSDFLHPEVSCAVSLYKPLAAPFGLADNLVGRYAAIWSTFIVEAIAIVSLFWRRWFAVGLIISLAFHYVIPISAFSWYMDFSSLVFALYMLSMPREVSEDIYVWVRHNFVVPLCDAFGRIGILLPLGALFVVLGVGVAAMTQLYLDGRPGSLVVHSVFVLIWAIVGGAAMVVMVWAAAAHLPFRGPRSPAQPAWLWIIPGLFFLSCLSPYLGLKTESSINMFSNLHTEGGQTNHLLFTRPPYLFSYQQELVRIDDASNPKFREPMPAGAWKIKFAVDEYLRDHPGAWITYRTRDGRIVERATAGSPAVPPANVLERKLLVFKQVDFNRPKVCTH